MHETVQEAFRITKSFTTYKRELAQHKQQRHKVAILKVTAADLNFRRRQSYFGSSAGTLNCDTSETPHPHHTAPGCNASDTPSVGLAIERLVQLLAANVLTDASIFVNKGRGQNPWGGKSISKTATDAPHAFYSWFAAILLTE